MMRMLLAAAAAALLAGAAQAQPYGGPPGEGPRQPPNFDLDHDGKVTLSEFKQVETTRVERMFARLDANHDGKITSAEFQAARERMQARRAQAGAAAPGAPGGGRGDFFFRMNDANNDGAVTKAEMLAGVERRFSGADTNHDGWLSKGELIMMRQRVRGGS